MPVGYPDIMLIAKGKAETPGTLNTCFIIGCSNLPIKSTNPTPINISEIIKKR